MPTELDSRIDQLYQLPLQEFTTARNALAKERSGSARRLVQSLAKPTLPIWSVNQLYWQDRPTYKALVDAAEKFRAAHRAALSGRKPDLRASEQVHRAAVDRAFAKTVAILQDKAAPASDAVVDQVRRALSALPSDEPAGRMTRVPAPVGFALLAGVKPRAIKPTAATKDGTRAEGLPRRSGESAKAPAREELQRAQRARARELSEAKGALRRAQQKAERAAFAARQAASNVERARKAKESLDEKLASAELLATETAGEVKLADRRLADLNKGV
jgi:hypothetical protein